MARIQLSGTQIPTVSKLNIDGELTLDAASGTSGQVLTSAGAGVTPTWTTPSSGSLGYIGNYQTTASSVTSGTVTIGGATGANIDPFKLSLLGGNTTSASTTGGSITIRGGNSTNTSGITTGGSITIVAGNGNATQGAGGNVTIEGGTGSGPSVNGNGNVYIGNASATDMVSIGNGSNSIYLSGLISMSGTTTLTLPPSLVLQTSGSPGVLGIGTDLQLNVSNSITYDGSGALGYSGETYYGAQTSSGRGRIPLVHSVFSQANATAGPSTGSVTVSAFAAANDVLSSLQAAKLYKFSAKYFISTSFTSGIYNMALLFTFSNAPASIKYSFKTYTQTVGTTIKAMGSGTSTTLDPLNGTQSASGTWVVEVDGYFITHATLTSTLTPQVQINPSAGGNNGATVQAGSWIEIEKIGTSTQTKIAGNWA